jgi:hypothetical protein
MYLLDENITKDQKELLEKWRFNVKQIGVDIATKGIQDIQIITLLQQLHGVLFLTRDTDFFKQHYCHLNYCIVYLDVEKTETAYFIRKFLKHHNFNTTAKRLGKIVKVSQTLILYYSVKSSSLTSLKNPY